MPTDLIEDKQELSSINRSNRMRELTEAFQAFSKKTTILEKAYQKLKDEFASVNIELEKTNLALNDKVEELARTSDYLNGILSQMTQGILFIRCNSSIATCNPAAESILGVDKEELLEQPFWSHFTDTFFGFSLKDALEQRTAHDLISIALKTPGGSAKYLDITTTFVNEGTPENRGLIILIRDVTEIRRLQLVAERNDRMKDLGEMAACVAHEIRNPLGGIKGFASLLVRDTEDRPEAQEMAQYIVDGTNALDRLVSSVLHYARPMELQPMRAAAQPMIQKVIQLVKADSKLNVNLTIHTEFPEEPLEAMMDPEVFPAALLNLMVNGIQAMNGGTLTIALREDGDDLLIRIHDEGCGIPEENREKIFTPFFTTKEQGTGFGLSEVHRIVETHGGTIELESEVNQGSTFQIRLPLAK